MIQKKMIDPARRRRLPEGFGWVDHRLVRENLIGNFSAESLALYLFLLTVGDEKGEKSGSSDFTPYQNLNKIQTFSTQSRIANDLQIKRFGYFSTFLFYEHHRN